MKAIETIKARGHENILSKNKSTFEITRDTNLTRQGTCIIAVAADKGIKNLSCEFKKILRKTNAKLTVVIQAGGEKEAVEALGNPRLTFNHSTDLVVRKSSYVCDRTLAIKANKAAKDFSRHLVAELKNPQQKVNITLTVEHIA